MASPAGSRAPRRSAGEVRDLLVRNARHVFAREGFAGASTRRIAGRAGVAEALIFRHFGTKAGLFEVAILTPFGDLINTFVDHWETQAPGTSATENLVADWVGSLYDLLSDERELVLALVAAHAFDAESSGTGNHLTGRLAGALERLEGFTRREMTGRGYGGDPGISMRALVGMVLAVAVLDDWLYAPGAVRPGRDTLVRELTSLLVFGIAGRTG